MLAQRGAAVLGAAAVLLLAGCGSSSPSSSPTSGATGASASAQLRTSASTPTGSAQQLYLSIGDSYAAGYQPTAPRVGSTNRNGFAYQAVDAAKAKGYDLRLTNLGCGGATTTSVLNQVGCKSTSLGPGAAGYDGQTQVAAAEQFLDQHRGQVALITVSIGGNDVTACGAAPNAATCVATALTTIKTNLRTLLTRLRTAAGPTTRIVGITYPDVILGDYLSPDAAKRATAQLSVTAFKTLINPALKAQYEAVGGTFVDVTKATGGYGSLTDTTDLAPYGTIPTPVAKVCELTFYCQFHDIHPRTAGYTVISDLVVGTLPKR